MIYAFDEYNSLEGQISIVRDLAYKNRPNTLYECVYTFMYITKELWHPVIQDMLCYLREDVRNAIDMGVRQVMVSEEDASIIRCSSGHGRVPWYEFNLASQMGIDKMLLINYYENITRPPYRSEVDPYIHPFVKDLICIHPFVNERHLLQAFIEILYMQEESNT